MASAFSKWDNNAPDVKTGESMIEMEKRLPQDSVRALQLCNSKIPKKK